MRALLSVTVGLCIMGMLSGTAPQPRPRSRLLMRCVQLRCLAQMHPLCFFDHLLCCVHQLPRQRRHSERAPILSQCRMRQPDCCRTCCCRCTRHP